VSKCFIKIFTYQCFSTQLCPLVSVNIEPITIHVCVEGNKHLDMCNKWIKWTEFGIIGVRYIACS